MTAVEQIKNKNQTSNGSEFAFNRSNFWKYKSVPDESLKLERGNNFLTQNTVKQILNLFLNSIFFAAVFSRYGIPERGNTSGKIFVLKHAKLINQQNNQSDSLLQ